jgi:hypothetical protein
MGSMAAQINAAQLPAAIRRQLGLSTPALRSRPRPSRARLGPDTGTYRCHTCTELFTPFTRAERHVRAEHHSGRIEVVL